MTDERAAVALVTGIEQVHGQALFGFARRLAIGDQAAADVVQEALLRLYDTLRGGKRVADPRAWMFTVVYRLAMDEHRRRGRFTHLDPLVEQPAESTAGDPVAVSERTMVWAEIDRLPERQRSVLYLRYRADLPFEDVGRVLGITSSAARSHATQALQTLRTRLNLGMDR